MAITLSGRLYDPYGNALPDASIRFRAARTGTQIIANYSAEATTDSSGDYTISVRFGTYHIDARQSDSDPWYTIARSIPITSDTTSTNVNDLIVAYMGADDATPEIVTEIESIAASASQAQAAAEAAQAAAQASASEASATVSERVSIIGDNASLPSALSGNPETAYVKSSTFGGVRALKAAPSQSGEDDGVSIFDVSDGSYRSFSGEMFPAGTSSFSSPLIPDGPAYADKVRIGGDHKRAAKLTTSDDAVFVYVREGFDIRDLSMSQSGTSGTGRGVSTNDAKQTSHSSHRDLTIEDFRYGIWKRYSLWDEYRNVRLVDNACGIRLARNSYTSDNANPDSPGGWNLDPGWFHNAITMDNVLIQGGEAGVIASPMCGTFINVTCQNQDTDGTANDVLPGSQQGTGVYLQSGSDGTRGYTNKFVNYYTEYSKIGMYLKDQRYVSVDGMFAQGGASSDPAEAAIIADNSTVVVDGFVGQDYFDNVFEAKNGATIYLNSRSGPYVGGTKTDATSRIKLRGEVDKNKFEYLLSKPADEEQDFLIPHTVTSNTILKIYLTGIYDGFSSRFGEVTVMSTNPTLATDVRWSSGSAPSNVEVTATNSGQVTVRLTGARTLEMYALVDVVGGAGLSGNALEITGTTV